MAPMFGWLREARELGLALEPRQAVRVRGEQIRQDFQRDIAIELGVAGTVHLTHATFTNLGTDFIDTEARPWVERHTQTAEL